MKRLGRFHWNSNLQQQGILKIFENVLRGEDYVLVVRLELQDENVFTEECKDI